MRLVGFTLGPNSSLGHTSILLRPPISTLNSTVRHILPYFFFQTLPPGREYPESLQAIRIQTQTDPFQHLRRKKGVAFDGKGITLERHPQRSPEVIRIDHEIDLTVTQFELLCPGLFYGTMKYPNLNLLLSERLFYAYIIDPVKLWNIMYDCLCCESWSERQEEDDTFKKKLFNNFYATQIYECRSKLDELQERVAATEKRTTLEKSIATMIENVHRMNIQRYKECITLDKAQLQMITEEKQRQIATKMSIMSDTDFETSEECSRQMICVLKSDLETMLHVSELELNQARRDLEERSKLEAVLSDIHAMICQIQEMLNVLNTSPSHTVEVEKARCILENNRSLQMLATVSNAAYKARYISDLQHQHQTAVSRIAPVDHEVELKKEEISLITTQLQKMKDDIRTASEDEGLTNARSDGPNMEIILNQLKKTLDDYVKATVEAANLEKQMLTEEKCAWREYLHIPSIQYDELISIAAALCAVDALLPVIEDNFEGFIYERVLELEASGEKVWVEGLSCRAIFRTSNAAYRVEQLMSMEHNVHSFQYNILERSRQSVNTSMLMECVVRQGNEVSQGGDSTMGYEELVTKVNIIVKHLKKSFELKQNLKCMRATRKRHQLEQQKLMDELHRRWHIENEADDMSFPISHTNFNILPKLLVNYIDITNKHLQLQARKDSLESFIRQLESDNLPTDLENLKQEQRLLMEQFKNALKEHGLNRQRFYENVRKLIDACETFHTELERNEEYRWMLHGSSSRVCGKLVNHWSKSASVLRRAIGKVQDISNETATALSVASIERLAAVEKEIRSLNAQETIFSAKIKASQHAITRYIEKYPSVAMQKRFTVPRHVPIDGSVLLHKISEAQRTLQAMPPAYKPEEIVRLKNKIKVLKQLEQLQTGFRDMHLNNLILPTIDKLHVKKLQQISKLVAEASEDLPELAGTVKVFFSYRDDGDELNDYERRMSTRLPSFKTSQIAAVNITIHDENGAELETIDESQCRLAFLLLFISFLYADNCKLFFIDAMFQDFFDNGIVGMMDVLQKHFPAMQFIILEDNS